MPDTNSFQNTPTTTSVDDHMLPSTPNVDGSTVQSPRVPGGQTPMVSNTPNKIPVQPNSAPLLSPTNGATALEQSPGGYDSNQSHPLVKKASLLFDVAQALAGGPRMQTVIGDDGVPIQKPVPLSKGKIGMAIVLEALTGGLAGISVRGPNAAGQGGALGLAQGQRIAQAKKDAEDREFAAKSKEIANRAMLAHTNMQTMLTQSEISKYSLEALERVIAIGKPTLNQLDQSDILASHISEPELLEGLKSGKYNSTSALGVADGVREVTGASGNKSFQATYSVIQNPNAMVHVDPQTYAKYSAMSIPGFPAQVSDAAKTFDIPFKVLANADAVVASRTVAEQRLNDLREELKGTADEAKVPTSIDWSKSGVGTALQKFQRYRSHSGLHGGDLYESVLQMQADPKDGKFANDVSQSFGGLALLRKAHDLTEANSAAIKTKAEAQARADVEIKKERDLIPVRAAAAGAETAARQRALVTSAKNEDGSWNQASVPVQLVEGNIDPTQLSKRSQSYNAQIEQANQYSLQKYGKPFDLATAQSDYKYATALSTQNTLKYLNSLTGRDNQSGNLGSLVAMSNVVTRTQFPALNDAAAWGRLQAGDKAIAQYKATVTEVADLIEFDYVRTILSELVRGSVTTDHDILGH